MNKLHKVRTRGIQDLNNMNFIVKIYNDCQGEKLDKISLTGLPIELYIFSPTVGRDADVDTPERKKLMSQYIKQYGLNALNALISFSAGFYMAKRKYKKSG